MLTRCSK